MQFYVNTKCRCKDGSFDSYRTQKVSHKEVEPPPFGQTQSGYGARMPTRYMVRWNGRWWRVRVIQYSNAGTAYIGRRYDPCLTVTWEAES